MDCVLVILALNFQNCSAALELILKLKQVIRRMHKVDNWKEYTETKTVKLQNIKYFYLDDKKKWPIYVPIGPIMAQILSKITRFFQIFLNLSQFWLKFGSLKNGPIYIPNFAFYKGSFIYL